MKAYLYVILATVNCSLSVVRSAKGGNGVDSTTLLP
jgi:hypothetical protein